MSFFHYSFENKLLVGCETPWKNGEPEKYVSFLKKEYEIKHILTLTTQFVPHRSNEITRHHILILMIPSREQAEKAILIIEGALAKKQAIAIHCTKGIDRTGCIIGCYMVNQGHEPGEIIDLLVHNVSRKMKRHNLKKILEPSYELLYQFVRQ
jgi:protein tyrosine/serine phosphatase